MLLFVHWIFLVSSVSTSLHNGKEESQSNMGYYRTSGYNEDHSSEPEYQKSATASSRDATAQGAMPLLIDTSLGKVLGRRKNKSLNVFLGIPFAEAPIGSLRFRPPRAKSPWYPEIYRALHFGAECLQSELYAGSLDDTVDQPVRDEDCLFLNIWQPVSAQRAAESRLGIKTQSTQPISLLPVLIWIHGGAFIHGGASRAEYDGSVLARKDVVVVTFNYRMGAFGFLVSTSDGLYGNYGLEDQKLAIQWVVENIERFGGDVNRITLFGESAGAMSVGLHMLDQQLATQYQLHQQQLYQYHSRYNQSVDSPEIRRMTRRNKSKNNSHQDLYSTLDSWNEILRVVQADPSSSSSLPPQSQLEHPSEAPRFAPNAIPKSTKKVKRMFQAVIMQSNPLGYKYRSITVANFIGRAFKELLDCEDLRCLQIEPVEELLHVQDTLMAVPRSIGDFFTWGPVLTDHSYYREIRLTSSSGMRNDDEHDAHSVHRQQEEEEQKINSMHQPNNVHSTQPISQNYHSNRPHALVYGSDSLTTASSVNAQQATASADQTHSIHFHHSFVSNITVRQPIDTLRALNRLDIPVLLGTNKHEGHVFVFTAFPTRMNKFIYHMLLFSFFRTAAPQIMRLYQPYATRLTQTSIYPDYRLVLSQILGDYLFRCPNQFVASQLTGVGTAVYLYEFALPTRTPGYAYCDGLSCHSCELPFVFGLRDSIRRNYHFRQQFRQTYAPTDTAPSFSRRTADSTSKDSSDSNFHISTTQNQDNDVTVNTSAIHHKQSINSGHDVPWRDSQETINSDTCESNHVEVQYQQAYLKLPRGYKLRQHRDGPNESIDHQKEHKEDTNLWDKLRGHVISMFHHPHADNDLHRSYREQQQQRQEFSRSSTIEYDDDEVDWRVSQLMTAYWTSFATHGDPNGLGYSSRSQSIASDGTHSTEMLPWWPRLLGDVSAFQAVRRKQQLRQKQHHHRHHRHHHHSSLDKQQNEEHAPGGVWKYLAGTTERIEGFDQYLRNADDDDDDAREDDERLYEDVEEILEISDDAINGNLQASVGENEWSMPVSMPSAQPTHFQDQQHQYVNLAKRLRELSISESDPRYQHYMERLKRLAPESIISSIRKEMGSNDMCPVDSSVQSIVDYALPKDNSYHSNLRVPPADANGHISYNRNYRRSKRKSLRQSHGTGMKKDIFDKYRTVVTSEDHDEDGFVGSQRFMHQMVFDTDPAIFVIENDCICSAWNRLEYRF
jgi:carboxylesterase type B